MHFSYWAPFLLPTLAAALTPAATTSCTEDTWVTVTSTISTSTSTSIPAGLENYGVMAIRSASPIHFAMMSAANSSFFLGAGLVNTSCPIDISDHCPPGNTTVFSGLNALVSPQSKMNTLFSLLNVAFRIHSSREVNTRTSRPTVASVSQRHTDTTSPKERSDLHFHGPRPPIPHSTAVLPHLHLALMVSWLARTRKTIGKCMLICRMRHSRLAMLLTVCRLELLL